MHLLYVIFTQHWSGVFPSQLKQTRVVPLLKKPTLDPDLSSSYRPISNLPLISKLIERVVAKRFTSFANSHHLFPSQQSAYRAHHSTATAVLSVHNDLVRATDKGHVSRLVLLDLSSAFDTVDHQTLLSVLDCRFRVQGGALNWFRSYLSDRRQSFHHSGKASANYPVTRLQCTARLRTRPHRIDRIHRGCRRRHQSS